MNRDYERLYRSLEPQAPAALELESLAATRPRSAALHDERETPLLPEQIAQLRSLLERDPDSVTGYFAELKKKESVSKDEAVQMLDELQHMLDNPVLGANQLESLSRRTQPRPPPAGFTFDGYDPVGLPIDTSITKFEEGADWYGYALAGGLRAALFHAGLANLGPFRWHSEHPSKFSYALDRDSGKDLRIGLFSDFANGYYHTRYLARRLAKEAYPYAIHLGDVYYAGKAEEVTEYLDKPLQQVLDAGTELFLLAGNHEMYSKGRPWLSYMDKKRAAFATKQRQEGTYFRLLRDGFQILGIDTEWFGHARFNHKPLKEWLGTCLAEGRANHWTTVLLSSNEPYTYGKRGATALFEDLKLHADAGRIDLWLWGNTHYCALFDRAQSYNFYGSCIGHGGFPYAREQSGKPTPAPLLFLETDGRFGREDIRPDRGNHGYCEMTLRSDGRVDLAYIDWMGRSRHRCGFARGADGEFRRAP
jgi:hypothetical protein